MGQHAGAVGALFEQFMQKAAAAEPGYSSTRAIPFDDEFAQLSDADARQFLLLCLKRGSELTPRLAEIQSNRDDTWRAQLRWIRILIGKHLGTTKDITWADAEAIAAWHYGAPDGIWGWDAIAGALAASAKRLGNPLPPSIRSYFELKLEGERALGGQDHRWIKVLRSILGVQLSRDIKPGEAWSDAALADINSQPGPSRVKWSELIELCKGTSGSTPSAKWLKTTGVLVDAVGRKAVCEHLTRWFPLVDRPRTQPIGLSNRHEHSSDARYPDDLITDGHMDVLKGLCWVAGTLQNTDLTRALACLAISAYRKEPGIGPRAVRVGNAAVYALGQIPGRDSLGQLAMLKVKIKFIPAQKGVEKSLTAAAEREGLPRDEIDELAVPSYGLTGVGLLEEAMGEYTARLTINAAGDTELVFVKKDGKIVKSAPAAVKAGNAEELKAIKAVIKDISAMLPAQKNRIDGLFLEQKSWALSTWRERYLDHSLVGVIARRLIWNIADRADSPGCAVTWLDGKLVDAAGRAHEFNADAAIVRLWHPLDEPTAQVLAWRQFFEDRGLQQPFKQAHREVYLLTDAELRTNTYSNRFAAHVLRQHQFHALCAARGWRNKLRLLVDAEYQPAMRRLERWGLRAEFWIEGAGDNFGVDTTESGAYLHLITDQVRFYPHGAAQASAHAGGGGYRVWRQTDPDSAQPPALIDDPNNPLALDLIPPLVLSEILRDVDLFVGVSSVGNNPTWQDGGPDNRYREYWWSYGFGELSGTAESRRELLERLIPRLKIAPKCELSGRFLVVKGSLREYKIHLGSGNILMNPNDQYLCIVPTSREETLTGVHLPFDGDRTLSIILSKAFMLADDANINDATITSQIRAGLA